VTVLTDFFAGIRRNLLSCCLVYVLLAAGVFVVFLVARNAGVDFFVLTKDPFAGQVESTPLYTSILSNLGVVLWCVTMTTQFFAAWIIRERQPGSPTGGFLFWTGLITAFLMLDDFLMLHERMNHTVEAWVFGTYGVVVAVVLLRYIRLILQTNFLILGGALFFFLLSMVLDNVAERLAFEVPYRTLLEDSFKLIGIMGWAVYFVALSARSALPAVRENA